MNASVHVVTTKCVFRYIQEPTSSTQPVPIAQCWSDGSTNTCSARSSVDDLARVLERRRRLVEDLPADQPVEPVRAAEQHDLPQQVPRRRGGADVNASSTEASCDGARRLHGG